MPTTIKKTQLHSISNSKKSQELEEIVTSPHKMIYLVGSLAMTFMSAVLVLGQTQKPARTTPTIPNQPALVKGESIKSDLALKQNYESSLKQILRNYLTHRLNGSWHKRLVLNQETLAALLKLRMPKIYQKLQLELIVVLTQEEEILKQKSINSSELVQVQNRLKDILDNYKFLN